MATELIHGVIELRLEIIGSAMRDLEPAVVQAAAFGMEKTEIAKRCGISRSTVYAILRRAADTPADS